MQNISSVETDQSRPVFYGVNNEARKRETLAFHGGNQTLFYSFDPKVLCLYDVGFKK